MQESADSLSEELDAQLEIIEQRLHQIVVSESPFITDAANHLIKAGGKRFRPGLVTVCSHLGQPVTQDKLISAALVVELTHVASLYHDDVMDEAALRRGSASANARYGNNVAILMGDYVFATASIEVAKLGPRYVDLQAKTFSQLVTGQIAETIGPVDGEDRVAHHLKVLDGKTASLIRTSCVFGGMLAGLNDELLQVLNDYGTEIGLIFQLSDDLIDITSDNTGKTPGTDLREGIPTLPTLLLEQSQDQADQALWNEIQGDLSDDQTLASVLAKLRTNHVIDDARELIIQRANKAKEIIAILPEGDPKNYLLRLCDEVVNRSS